MVATTGPARRVRPPTLPPRRARFALAAAGAGVPLVAAATLALTGSRVGYSALLDPGVLTRWGLPAVTGVRDVAATLTVGLLALAVLTMWRRAPADSNALGPDRLHVVRWAAASAVVWSAAAAVLLLLTFSDITGRPAWEDGFTAGLASFVVDVQLGRLLLGGALFAAFVAAAARRTTLLSTTVVLLLVSAGALLLLAAGGHAASDAGHGAAVNTMFAHLLSATTWSGGLVGLVLLRTAGYDVSAVARRFSVVAGACFGGVAVSGVWRVLVRVDDLADLAGPYGVIVAGKAILLAILGAAGAVHRRRTLPRLAADPDRWAPFLALVLAEVMLIAVAMGLGVALSRTPLP